MSNPLHRHSPDLLRVIAWVSVAAAVAVFLAGRTHYGWDSVERALTSLGAIAGLVAMDLTVLMLLMVARIPFVDRAIGHDGAVGTHKGLGTWTFVALASHLVLLLAAWAIPSGGYLPGAFALWGVRDIALAILGTGLILVVGATSMAAARRHLPREVWWGIHVTSYAALALSIPHQFSTGGLLAEGPSRAYWMGLLLSTGTALLVFRVLRPLLNSLDHAPRVTRVERLSQDSVAITMTGRRLDQLRVQAGQFFLWRFWERGLWWHQHPFSISAAPTGSSLTITVRALGRGSAAVTGVRPGTRVSFEGPFGLFTPSSRRREGVVLAGAGVGLGPVRSLLEEMPLTPGRAVVLARGSTPDDLLHLSDLDRLCRAKGAQLVALTGPRGSGWLPARFDGARIGDIVPWIAHADLYLCGPAGWGHALVDDARSAGLDPDHIHHERFSW